MLARSIMKVIQNYLKEVALAGIPVSGAILYGSYARGEQHPESDIDLIVLSPLFDQDKSYQNVAKLWRLRVRTDWRIEPVAAGVREWAENRGSPLLAIARQEGIVIQPN